MAHSTPTDSQTEYLIPLHARDGSVVDYAIVDEQDHKNVSMHRWHLCRGYASTNLKNGASFRSEKMHRLILKLSPHDGLMVDHANRDKLDNRRSNLRLADYQLNSVNRSNGIVGVSKYKGVTHPQTSCWYARIAIQKKRVFLGSYQDELAAANIAVAFRVVYGYQHLAGMGIDLIPFEQCALLAVDNSNEGRRSSKYRGVAFINRSHRLTRPWIAAFAGRKLGYHASELDAACVATAHRWLAKELNNADVNWLRERLPK